MKKFSKFLFSFFVIILISSLIPFSVNAQSYYNHIQNSSFVTITDICEHGDFENNAFDDGEVYGNWTSGGATFASGGYPTASSQYYMSFVGGSVEYVFHEDYQYLGADIENITFWAYTTVATSYVRVVAHYLEGGSDTDDYAVSSSGTWFEYSCIDIIDVTKTVANITFSRVGTNIRFDYVNILVGGSMEQDTIGLNTEPWYTLQTVTGYFGDIVETDGNTDSYSCLFDGVSALAGSQGIAQDIRYLDSDSIQYVDCYLKGAVYADGEGVRCVIGYSDGTWSQRDKYVTGNGTEWEYINFGVSFIDSDKYITVIWFLPLTDVASFTFLIDDLSLWSNTPTGYERFDFVLSPTPIDYGSFNVEIYAGQTYTFSGFVYNLTNNELNENGTYTFNSNFGSVSGYLINGQFNVSISARSYSTSPYIIEVFTVVIVVGSQVDVFEIDVYWYPTTGSSVDSTVVTTDFITNWFVIAIFLIVIPLGATVYIGFQIASEPNPALMLVTFMAFETIMGAVSLASGVINIWFMLVIIIADVLIIMGLLKTK